MGRFEGGHGHGRRRPFQSGGKARDEVRRTCADGELGRVGASLEEPNLVGGGVEQIYFASNAMRFDAWAQERVALVFQLGVKSFDVVNENKDRGSGGAIAVVRRKVQDERPTRHLHENWAVALTFLPVELAPEVVEIGRVLECRVAADVATQGHCSSSTLPIAAQSARV
jgi:hypothetical protein